MLAGRTRNAPALPTGCDVLAPVAEFALLLSGVICVSSRGASVAIGLSDAGLVFADFTPTATHRPLTRVLSFIAVITVSACLRTDVSSSFTVVAGALPLGPLELADRAGCTIFR